MLGHVLLIGLGGALGSIARYLTVLGFARILPTAFPLGTLVVNVTGCFLIGLIFGLFDRYGFFTTEWRMFLATGFCGGFTTFSAFAYENLLLIESRDYTTFALNVLATLLLCIGAAFVGLIIARP